MATPFKNPYHFENPYDPVKEAERLAAEQAQAQKAVAIGQTLGTGLGGTVGSFFGPLGTAAGSALGSLTGGFVGAIPTLFGPGTEFNKQRLAEIKRKEALGMLGLTDREKQLLFNAGQSGIQGELAQAQNIQRAAGAAGMASGAGSEALRAAQASQQGAELLANVTRDISDKDFAAKQAALETKEMLKAAIAGDKQRKLEAVAGIAAGGLNTFFERYGQENTIQGKAPIEAVNALAKSYGVSTDEAKQMSEFANQNPEAIKYFDMIMKGKA